MKPLHKERGPREAEECPHALLLSGRDCHAWQDWLALLTALTHLELGAGHASKAHAWLPWVSWFGEKAGTRLFVPDLLVTLHVTCNKSFLMGLCFFV